VENKKKDKKVFYQAALRNYVPYSLIKTIVLGEAFPWSLMKLIFNLKN